MVVRDRYFILVELMEDGLAVEFSLLALFLTLNLFERHCEFLIAVLEDETLTFGFLSRQMDIGRKFCASVATVVAEGSSENTYPRLGMATVKGSPRVLQSFFVTHALLLTAA